MDDKSHGHILTLQARRWVESHAGELVATLGSVIIMVPSFFSGSNPKDYLDHPWWWWACALLSAIFLIGAFALKTRVSPSREELLVRVDYLMIHQERWNRELYEALESISRRLLDATAVSRPNQTRLSVYYHRDRHFILVSRGSGNPDLTQAGRSQYDDNQGIISITWRNAVNSVTDLPADREE